MKGLQSGMRITYETEKIECMREISERIFVRAFRKWRYKHAKKCN